MEVDLVMGEVEDKDQGALADLQGALVVLEVWEV